MEHRSESLLVLLALLLCRAHLAPALASRAFRLRAASITVHRSRTGANLLSAAVTTTATATLVLVFAFLNC